MYRHILVPLENSRDTDRTILNHVRTLARMCGARLLLLHVADGWAARNFESLKLQESDEMREDRRYLAEVEAGLVSEGFAASSILAMGDPAAEIVRVSREENVDLIAMTTHGHRLIGDIVHGSTADKVRHRVDVPVLLLKVRK